MKLDPISLILNKELKLNNSIFFIGGNEITLMEKVSKTIVERFNTGARVRITHVDTIEDFVDIGGLFDDKKIFIGKNCKGINEKNLDKIKATGEIFIFIQENSSKTKVIKNIFSKDKETYMIDCYELDKKSKITILNEFLKTNKAKIAEDLFWVLVEKLDSKYIFFENTINKLLELRGSNLSYDNIKKILTIDDSGKQKIFLSLLKKNKTIVELYKEKILSTSDVNDLYYYCRFFCNLIIDSRDENDYNKKIPVYLFKEKSFLIDIYRKYNNKKKRMLLDLLFTSEKLMRKNSDLSLIFGLRFFLNIKKITVS
tara:strand:- start:1155 stop:2093 length:939 start_codon:yes stop_codon:yes gene_type:complete